MPFIEFNTDYRTKAIVIYPEIFAAKCSLPPQARLEEAVGLALAINLDVIHSEIVKVRTVKPATLIGQGVLDYFAEIIEKKEIELVIFDTGLTPIQQRNLEQKLKIKVIDRTALILEIFGERAQTKEGKLQVELAHLTYQRSRLVRSWTHLERQRGGAGFLGGPGEKQIELDRRIIDDKILRIKQDLEKVKRTRTIQRSARKRVPYPVVAFVGYTNAGKSTLFNTLSGSNVFAKDLLFATLDPSMRKIKLPRSGREIILSDTVGFISDLPHELIMAFRATLEEVLEADLIVHIRDISSEVTIEQRRDVLAVLENLGFTDFSLSAPYLEVLNKIDLLTSAKKQELQNSPKAGTVLVSAVTGEGTEKLLQTIEDKLSAGFEVTDIILKASDGKTIAWIYANAEILHQEAMRDIIKFKIKISAENAAKLKLKK